jgi:predicted Zn-dependent peptidase
VPRRRGLQLRRPGLLRAPGALHGARRRHVLPPVPGGEENRGLCYSIGTFGSAYVDSGLLGIEAGTAAKDVPELCRVVDAETAALVASPDEAELARARAQLKAGTLMALESCHAVCEGLARQLLCVGRRVPTAEILAKIDAVDAAAVRRVGERLFRGRPVAMAAIGPLKKLPRIELGRVAG